MSENDDLTIVEDDKADEQIQPHVNEKIKIYVIIFAVVLAIISACLVLFGPDVPDKNATNQNRTIEEVSDT